MIPLANIKKLLFYGFVVASFAFLFRQSFSFISLTYADLDCEGGDFSGFSDSEIDHCWDVLEQKIKALEPAHEYNKKELADLRTQLDSLERRIFALSKHVKTVEANIDQREEDLAYAQEIFELKTNNHYKFLRLYDPLLPFLSSDASEAFREMNFRQRAADEDRRTMEAYAQDLYDLKQDKEELEKNQAFLAAAKKQVDEREKFLAGEVAKVESYIASLSSRQQQFIAQKLGSLNLPTTLGAGPLYCMDDRTLNPGFSPAFAFYTYGIPHRVGMNQYGAYGRAKSGQSAEAILKEYFNNVEIAGGFEGKTVVVNKTNEFSQTFNNETMNIEDYLKHLHEMPTSWPQSALEAQAIAARSYALRVYQDRLQDNDPNNNFLYPSQKDQVIKRELNDSTWQGVVDATRGRVITQGGQPIKAWYASTSGGYTFTSAEVWGGGTGWTKNLRDTSSGVGSFGDLNSSSYDKDSPCFYAAQGWRGEYDNSAWLKSEEVADIANVILLSRADSSTREHLYQTDKPHPYGGEIWSEERVKSELRDKNITPFNNVSGISISADFGGGRTTNVSVSGDAGTENFSGEEFKDFFNLRAPANIQIVGPLYNIEKK